MAASLQQFIPLLATQDIKKRIQLGSDILSCLQQNPSCLSECDEIGFFIDSISSWLNNSNFKVAQNGIEIMTILAEEMKEDFKPYISTIFSATVDRLGDSKDQVRLQAKGLMLKLMNPVSSPQHVFEKLSIAFNHKNFRVREEVMVLLQQTLDKFGSTSLTISRLMPALVKLLGDPNSQVRDTAMATLVHVYKHVGERLRQDLSKRAGIPAPKLQLLFTKFDEVRTAGALLPSALERAGQVQDDKSDQTWRLVSISLCELCCPPA
ncbi:CLIP-associating protein 1-like [Uloborus diversus]|uniref:CLIP-associating protein 1-like n=1 Tax=Uloborus diversus TaxID=327109 RepID=UPI0024091487|nr:CLIP-associating protein 1-like [Uloborus diversus]